MFVGLPLHTVFVITGSRPRQKRGYSPRTWEIS